MNVSHKDMHRFAPPSSGHSAVLPFGARPMQDWLALSGKGLIDEWANPFQALAQGCFIAEFRLPLPMGKVLIHSERQAGVERGFSLFSAPDGSISLRLRQGGSVLRIGMPVTSFGSLGTLRMTYRFDAGQKKWNLILQSLGPDGRAQTQAGVGGIALGHLDIDTICKAAICESAVLWYGFCRTKNLPQNAPWIGLRTPVETVQGTVAAGNLRVGDTVLTLDRGPCAVRAVHRVDLPARGSFAPILLRGSYFDPRGDLLVSANQLVGISGSAVEYLFGAESVLVAARDLVDGKMALADDRRNVIKGLVLDLGGAALIGQHADRHGISLAVGDAAQSGQAPLPCLNSFETVALMRMLGRIVSKVA